ncbi:hypothetical protein [Mesorhizobium sp. M1378]|uniref:hypothetical protein n=1 Tax=Mesorhizobium sp. M1378 TaxID=2957092 RepID=UPI00333CF483
MTGLTGWRTEIPDAEEVGQRSRAHTAFAARNSKGWEAIGRAVLEGAGQGVDDALVQVRQSGLYRLIAGSVASDSE